MSIDLYSWDRHLVAVPDANVELTGGDRSNLAQLHRHVGREDWGPAAEQPAVPVEEHPSVCQDQPARNPLRAGRSDRLGRPACYLGLADLKFKLRHATSAWGPANAGTTLSPSCSPGQAEVSGTRETWRADSARRLSIRVSASETVDLLRPRWLARPDTEVRRGTS